MNNEECKNDIEEFNNLKNQIDLLWKELDNDGKDNIELMKGKNKEKFVSALTEATDFVNSISGYFDDLEKKQIYLEGCDFNNRKNKTTQKYIKTKKVQLDDVARQVSELIEKPKLSSLFLEVTLRCNAKCEHCGSSCGYSIPKDEISAEELKKALLDVHNKYGSENVFLMITGGEPLMRKDLFDIMKYAVDLGFHWGMTTNGMLIDEKMVENLKKTNIESISISLDGMEKTHENFRKVPGSFKKIMKAIDLLKKLDCLKFFQITTVVNKKNINELEDIYNLLLEKDIKEWRVLNVDPIGRAYENDEILLDKDGFTYMLDFIYKKRNEGKINVTYGCSHYLGLKYEDLLRDVNFVCGAGLFIGSILSNGDICVCPNVRDKKLVQGNIKNEKFTDVWENKFEVFRKKRLTTNEKCKKCKSFKYCRGDSFHTWNFTENKPNMCMKEILTDDFIE